MKITKKAELLKADIYELIRSFFEARGEIVETIETGSEEPLVWAVTLEETITEKVPKKVGRPKKQATETTVSQVPDTSEPLLHNSYKPIVSL